MKNWALIVDGLVREITDIDPQGRFHPSMQWVLCGDEVVPGWTYSGAAFSAPAGPDLGKLKADSIAQVRALRTAVFSTLAGIQSQSLASGDTDTAKAICGLQESLKLLPEIDLSACLSQDDINTTFTQAWKAIAALAPAAVQTAFREVLG